jgi:hypothetical protein
VQRGVNANIQVSGNLATSVTGMACTTFRTRDDVCFDDVVDDVYLCYFVFKQLFH